MMLQDDQPSFYAASIAGIIIPTFALGLRGYSRSLSKTPLWWDDWMALVTLPFALAICSIHIYWTNHGLGTHPPTNNPSDLSLEKGVLLQALISLLYNIGILPVKLSALFCYARVFKPLVGFRRALWVVGACCVAWSTVFTLLGVFGCESSGYNALLPRSSGKCTTTRTGGIVADAVTNMLLDVVILLLPHVPLWRLQMGRAKKLGLAVVFGLGYGVLGISIYRVITVSHITPSPHISNYKQKATAPLLALLIEIPIAITCVSLPAIYTMARRAAIFGTRSLYTRGNKTAVTSTPTTAATSHRVWHKSSISQKPLNGSVVELEKTSYATNETAISQSSICAPIPPHKSVLSRDGDIGAVASGQRGTFLTAGEFDFEFAPSVYTSYTSTSSPERAV